MGILGAKENWSQTFEMVCHAAVYVIADWLYVYIYLRDDDKSSVCQLCNDLLQEQEKHPSYKMKSHIRLAALADISPVAEMHFKDADATCNELLRSRQTNKEEEILTHQEIIKSGLRGPGPEMREWKIEEGLYISSSDEDSEKKIGQLLHKSSKTPTPTYDE